MGVRFVSVDVVLDQAPETISPSLFGSACGYADAPSREPLSIG